MAGSQANVHLFERAKEACEGRFELRRAAPGLMEIASPELAGDGDDGSAHGTIFLRPLRPR